MSFSPDIRQVYGKSFSPVMGWLWGQGRIEAGALGAIDKIDR